MRVTRWGLAVLVAFTMACSDGGPANVDLNGPWQYGASVSNAPLSTSCQMSGTATLSHRGRAFNGTVVGDVTCSGPGGIITDDVNGAITGGQINDATVTFTDGECSYTGRMTGDPVNRMSGTAICTIAIAGTNYTFTGPWQAGR